MASQPTRRAALRLLAGILVVGLLPQRGVTSTHARQRPDRDGDGLFDDDELEVYFTDPDVYDTDADGVGDGEEVYVGTDPRTPEGIAPPAAGGVIGAPPPDLVVDAGGPPVLLVTCADRGLADCAGVCVDVYGNDPNNCGICGGICMAGGPCCRGVCADLSRDNANCGACGNSCPLGGFCQGGVCTGLICPAGLTDCGRGHCVDLMTDSNNCGNCGGGCFGGYSCQNGACN